MRLRMRIGIGSAFESTGSVICDPMTLSRTVDSICPSQSSIEPLRAVWRRHLVQKHVSDFIVKRLRIFGCFEISVRFSPVFPASRESMHDLLDRTLRTCCRLSVCCNLWNSRLTEIFADNDVGCELTPLLWNLCVIHCEDHGPIRVLDLA